MSIHFHELRVKEVKKETSDCVSVLFDVPETLKEAFEFTQGQSLTMRSTINGEEVRRTYSICSSPLEHQLKVAIKKVDGGLFSSFANEQLKKNDMLEVMTPIGRFYTTLDTSNRKNYVAFAAGSGITPLLSIIKTTLVIEPDSTFTLVYGNKTRSSIIFFEELEGLKNKYINRFNLIHMLSREKTDADLNFGRITKDKCSDLFSKLLDVKTVDEFFICGPEEMIFSVKDFLESNGVSDKKIHFELFTTPGQNKKSEVRSTKYEEDGPQSKITVKLDGRSFDFSIPLNSNTTILDAAMHEGADVPYACKGGVCCTCKAKLLEGEVKMDVHWGLEQEEIEQGFILTCQSHPVTDKVTVDFDVK
ncbi:1,2-phenylacetyl-CoA epoxidase subunit PaaE [Lacibacter sediminis]|uniref:Phenylacetate-CoA oxygenase/reductase subunit PaaK n=1 Tax=Lacibacter sediminis TaxID=2760713 RepID=A0A7G5XHC1_9BACT|nr:1,2-phenylacetyl-CoA epoxidase subunit PaaE [Lacibacter sediminis]QNA44874.1 phenylacetate-CoA oxygenase/reductase subunit PaaK [Lacibacter sediminis]